MKVQETLSDGLRREYSIHFSAADIASRVDARITALAPDIKMPGFRPGKVPLSVVKSRYSSQVLGEVLQTALDEATRKTIDDNKLRVASNPALDVNSYDEGGDLKASLKIEVMPEIEAVDVAALTIDRPSVDVADSEIEEALGRIAEENRPTTPIAKPRAAKSGDTVVIDFIGRVDGVAFEGGTATGHRLALGSNSFIPGFEDGLIGAKIGKTLDVKVAFPAEYPAENLAGKDSVFEVTVHEIHEPGEIKIDDGFAASLGMDNLTALKAAIGEQIGYQHATAIRTKVKTSVLDAIDAVLGEFDVPPTLTQQEYQSVCHSMNPHSHDDHDHKDGEQHSCDENMNDDEKAEAQGLAQRRVRLGLALTEIGRTNNLQVTDEEKNRAIAAEAQRHPGQEQQVFEYFQKNPEAAQRLAGPIFEDKVIDYILEMATVNDHTVSVEELYKMDDEGVKKTPKKAAKKAAKKTAKKAAPKAAKKSAPKAAKKATAKKAAKKAAPKKESTS